MPYLPESIPGPIPDLHDAPFWENCSQRRLTFQRCADCRRFRHPPTPLCPWCQSRRIEWAAAPARGRVFTWTTIHYAADPSVAGVLPYNVTIVEFPECDGVRLVTNVIDAEPGGFRVGMPVELVWEDGGGAVLPRFRKAGP
jgi:uncharacterized OB-fold protein